MMKRTVALFAFGFCALFSNAQQFELLQSTDQLIRVSHEFTELAPGITSLNSVSYWDMDKTYRVTSKNAGAPSLPMFSESVVVPNTGDVSLVVEYDGYTEYTNVNILPSKGSLKRNVDPNSVPYTFGAAYNTNAFYPGALASMSEPYNLRNTRGVAIQVSPVQYNPVTGVVRIYHNIRVGIVTNPDEAGINELPEDAPVHDAFSAVYAQQYLNAESILGRYTPVEEEGEMLVIAADQFVDLVQPLVDWKIQSGIKTTLVSKSVAGSTDTDIKSYITNFYSSNPNLVFVLLVGDHTQLPSHTYGNSGGEQLWSDSYYGQLTGDYYPELFVGRFSGTTTSHISTQVDRTLEYEKNPASGDWMEKAIGLASNQGSGIGDDGEADWQHARNIRTKLMNFGYTQVYEFYDGSHGGDDASGDPNSSMVTTAVNDGIGLFNYTGHGDQNTCISGNFSSTNINAATNNGNYPFVISVACNNGTFTSGTCISESWSWATNNGTPTGAIGACGSSILMAWAEPMQTQDEMTELITEAYPSNLKKTLGGLFYNSQMSMLETYNNSNTAKEVMQTWVFFGDPSTLFRNKQTLTMDVSHIGNVPLGTTSVDVNCDVDGALVTIVQEGLILGKGLASGGMATITFPALVSDQPLIVTAVKQNYRPYQGVITVANGPAGIEELLFDQVSVYPNPATDVLNVSWNEGLNVDQVQLLDLSGKLISSAEITGSASSFRTEHVAPGMYIVRVTSLGTAKTFKVTIQ